MPRFIKFLIGLFKYLKKKKGTKSFFYTNDLRSLIDAIIRELGNTSNNELKKQYVTLMYHLILTPEYKKEKHRAEDIEELFDSLLELEDEEEIDDEIKEYIENIKELQLL